MQSGDVHAALGAHRGLHAVVPRRLRREAPVCRALLIDRFGVTMMGSTPFGRAAGRSVKCAEASAAQPRLRWHTFVTSALDGACKTGNKHIVYRKVLIGFRTGLAASFFASGRLRTSPHTHAEVMIGAFLRGIPILLPPLSLLRLGNRPWSLAAVEIFAPKCRHTKSDLPVWILTPPCFRTGEVSITTCPRCSYT